VADPTLSGDQDADAERRLRETLREIEALFAGAATAGEKAAADAAATRIRRQFAAASEREKSEEFKFSIPDPRSRQLFTALWRRHGLRPFRYTRMHRQTVTISAPAIRPAMLDEGDHQIGGIGRSCKNPLG
jgi:hypothetical protein